ncbi:MULTISPECIES: hypothetical protein [unclassified Acidovorax]|uniref:hypothetical protein n=1 Tax=unclassified Acidovorax TaxID=2684926 RepID=UPI00288330D0|nr:MULTISPECIES: hypothetical protein [unclassified Acidovorax]
MTPGVALAMKGLCEICQAKTHHGPRTTEQIQAICADLGTDPAEFSDWCDDCFVTCIGNGDAAFAQGLSAHELQATKPEYVEQLRHMKFLAAGRALQEFRAKHGPCYREAPESIPLFEEMLKHAPPEVYAKFLAKAKELDLVPKTKFVNDAGEPVFSAEQIAEKLGMPVANVENEIRERFGDKVEAGNVHPVQ